MPHPMFRKILIANRGEIACRVITTARSLGIQTVAVYSDADAQALHVEMADEAVWIGTGPAADSYLQGSRIIAAALATGAEAIHPGYGFLSENPDFVDAVTAAGLVFIGPTASAMRAMGLKDAAKSLMQKAGVPVVPGYHGPNQSPDFLAAEAARIGYPVLIKACAGGGGKGMRRVDAPHDFAPALASAQREALAAFGDQSCLIEKYIPHPRHIEIQLFGDAHGNVIHLFERDCSLQRRHQKVIEEAPAPFMPATVRAAMCRAAVKAGQAIGYRGAGTVEFIADGSGPLRPDGFWFMEMNTRLQVEHPVSEAITGLDLVELQLRIAAGEPLPISQADVKINGWAIEARLYAEDADTGFLPATGTLDHLSFPPATKFRPGPLRIDSGVRPGDTITPYFDPMIAKIIAHGPTRDIALNRLSAALHATHALGSTTNLRFLTALTAHHGFRRGEVDTGLIARDLADLLHQTVLPPHIPAAAAVSALGFLTPRDPADPWVAFSGWRHWQAPPLPITLRHGRQTLDLRVTPQARHRFEIHGAGFSLSLTIVSITGSQVVLALPDRRLAFEILTTGRRITICADDRTETFDLPDPATIGAPAAGGDGILSPMPGLVIRLAAQTGQLVTQGEVLIVLEAMKMEHALTAPRDGTVAEVLCAQGEQVTSGAKLLTLEPPLV